MKDYKKYYIIKATPSDVYKALTLEHIIMLWTGDSATMQAIEGSEFSLYDGGIVGKNLEFIEDKKIVQQWYFDEASDNSIVTIKLHEHKNGTSVELVHTNIPDEAYEDITDGWDNYYFGELQDFYNEDTD